MNRTLSIAGRSRETINRLSGATVAHCNLRRTDPSEVVQWQQRYLQMASAPLDGMWLSFAAVADHYAIDRSNKVIGFCVVNSEHKLLQFLMEDPASESGTFAQVLLTLDIHGAVASTSESRYLALCQKHFRQRPTEIALMYHVPADQSLETPTFPSGSEIRSMAISELEPATEFTVAAISADPDWLRTYYLERIRGQELFGLWQADDLIATGECRPSQMQPAYADVGMIVGIQYRGRGIATNMLRWLIHRCRNAGLCAICSTESDNKAAQRAIEHAGFVGYHRILEFSR